MGITSGIVLYAVLWFMTFLVAIPIRLRTQGESGDVVPGTHQGAPEQHFLRQKALITTLVAAVLWAILAWVILSGVISVRDFDWFGRLPATPAG